MGRPQPTTPPPTDRSGHRLIALGRDPRQPLRHGQALFDLTIFAGGLVICLFVVSWRVFLDRRIVPLLWLAPSALLLVLVSFDLGRVMVPVALLTLPAASLAISQFRRPRGVMAATLLLSGAVGLARTTSLYESGGHLLIAISV